MIAASVNIRARVTEPFYFEMALSIEDEGLIDFTDEDMRLMVREAPTDSRTVLDLSIENGWLIVMTPDSNSDANLAVSVPLDISKAVPVGTYYYDLRYWRGPVLMAGRIEFVYGITR